MRVLFAVFSGTGNTARVCRSLAEEVRSLGHEADLFPIRTGSARPDPASYDVLVVGYPVHAFNAPSAVLDFLKSLPKGRGKRPCYLVRTSGEPLALNEASVVLPRRILKRRGYTVTGEYRYVMPYNIIFRHSEGMASRMWLAAEKRLPADAEEMVSGGGTREHVGPIKRLVSFVLRIEHPAMPMIGRHFKPTERCIGCGACVGNCPQGNITMKEGKPTFGKSCIGCMACSFLCPEDAIDLSLFNGWRVNGRYTFAAPPASDAEVCRYCRKSYLRYFHSHDA